MPCAPGESRAWTVMPRRPDALAAFASFAAFAISFLVSAAAPAAAEYNPDGSEPPPVKLSTLIAAGAAVAIGSDLGTQPQLGCFRDLPGSWQLGMQARLNPADAKVGYDFLPQVNLAVRKLWLS